MSPFFFHRSTSPSDLSRFPSRVVFGVRTTRMTRGRRSRVQQVRLTVNRTSRRRNHQEWYMSNRESASKKRIAPFV